MQTFKQTHDRLKKLEERTAPPKEDGNVQDAVAGTYGNLGGFGNGMLMIENGGMGGMPAPMPPRGGIDMSGFAGAQQQPGMMPPQGMMPNGGMPQM